MMLKTCRKCYSSFFSILALMLTTLLIITPAHAEDIFLGGGGGTIATKARSLKDMKFKRIYRQQYDFSCGSAALASMLTFYYNRPHTEKEVLEAMYEIGNQEKIKSEGFSLLDMKNYLTSIGLQADGYRESLDKLRNVGVPAIVLVNIKGYLHFVLIQGVTDTEVLLGDPALGTRTMKREKFESVWQSGILFVILDEIDVARKKFFDEEYLRKAKLKADFDFSDWRAFDLRYDTLHFVNSPGYF